MHRIRTSLVGCLALAAASSQPPAGATPGDAPDVHAAYTRTTPGEVLEHLRAGASNPRRTPARRPSGAGRYLAAIVVDAAADLVPHELLGQRRRDLLVLSSPGPVVRSEELAAIEQQVAAGKLALAVVVVPQTAETIEQATGPRPAPTPAARGLARRLAPARQLATRRGCSLAAAHAHLLGELITGASTTLREAAARGRFRVALAIVGEGGEITWSAPWWDRPLPEEVRPAPALQSGPTARNAPRAGQAPDPAPPRRQSGGAEPGPPVPYPHPASPGRFTAPASAAAGNGSRPPS